MFKLFGGSERNCDGFLFESVSNDNEETLFDLQAKPTKVSEEDNSDDSSLSNTFDDISCSSLSLSNFTSLSSVSPMLQVDSSSFEQLRLTTQECLETSASYMNEIESFFQQLSTGTGSSNSTCSAASTSSSSSTLSSFDFDISLNNIIDPSIFINQSILVDPEGTTTAFRSSKKSFDYDSSSDSGNSRQKTPKFYSRSGQIADPSRGPCHNCHTTLTCYWRKLKGEYHCNACTLFFKRNKYHRNVETAEKPIKRRNRKSKYSS